MNWEMIGWIALAASTATIVASLFVRSKPAAAGNAPHAMHSWLELAWPVFFIAAMAMLTFKEVLNFPAVLLLAIVITGLVWLVDAIALRKQRAKDASEPIVVEMAKSFFPVILIVFLLRSFLYEPFKIPSGSMVPTLLVGDFILVNKYTYGVRLPVINKTVMEINKPSRGDVMVFRYPEMPSKDFIKRVIGLPGDKIEYRNKQLTINGKPQKMEKTGVYTEVENLQMQQFDAFKEFLDDKPHTMMQNPLVRGFNLGQVRANFPHKKNCAYNEDGLSCTVPDGHYFMMGDSRDNSDDGRFWGFVPEENIVGKAVLVWMNFSALKRVGTRIE